MGMSNHRWTLRENENGRMKKREASGGVPYMEFGDRR